MLLLHGALLLMLLTLPSLQRAAQPQRLLLRLQALPKPPAPVSVGRPSSATRSSLLPAAAPSAPTAPAPRSEALEVPAAASAAPAAALDLRLPLGGPQASRGARSGSLSGLASQMRADPRANSPRLGLEERFAVALGTPCFVDALNADGVVQRYPGRWVALPSQSDSIWQGVTGNLGAGGKAPAMSAPTCQRQ